MPTGCKKGEIWRVAYSRVVGKRGSKKESKKMSKKVNKKTSKTAVKRQSKKILVPGKCIKARSQTGYKMSDLSRQQMKEKKMYHELAREKFGEPKCARGEIMREGFKRTSKTGKNIWVPPMCVKDVGKKGKQEMLFILQPARLSKYGYDSPETRSDLARHKALKDAIIAGEKPLSLSRRLNALYVLTKNTNPKLSRIYKEDSEWIKMTDEYQMERAK